VCRQRAHIYIHPREVQQPYALPVLVLSERCSIILFQTHSIDSCDTWKGKKFLLGLIANEEPPPHPDILVLQRLQVAVPVQCLPEKLAVLGEGPWGGKGLLTQSSSIAGLCQHLPCSRCFSASCAARTHAWSLTTTSEQTVGGTQMVLPDIPPMTWTRLGSNENKAWMYELQLPPMQGDVLQAVVRCGRAAFFRRYSWKGRCCFLLLYPEGAHRSNAAGFVALCVLNTMHQWCSAQNLSPGSCQACYKLQWSNQSGLVVFLGKGLLWASLCSFIPENQIYSSLFHVLTIISCSKHIILPAWKIRQKQLIQS